MSGPARQSLSSGGSNSARAQPSFSFPAFSCAAPLCRHCERAEAPAERSSRVDPYAAFIAEAAQTVRHPRAWIRAVMRVESAGDVRAISSAGAMGLMQIMPATWADLRVRHRLGSESLRSARQHSGGRGLSARDARSLWLAGFLAAYNAGPRPLRRVSRGPPIACRNARLCRRARPCCRRRRTRRLRSWWRPPIRNAWTRAPLFVVQSTGRESAVLVQSERAPGDSTTAAPARDQGPMASRADGLFVARSVSGGPR
jgi:soluble lytic murein transglycosylase-like protein